MTRLATSAAPSSSATALHAPSFLAGVTAAAATVACVGAAALVVSRQQRQQTRAAYASNNTQNNVDGNDDIAGISNGELRPVSTSDADDAGTTTPAANPPSPPSTQQPTKPELMDSPSLDQRMIRKAEGAIRNRTSRLIIVVERCTNDHNYSAILRTAEALGVQHVWIIAPKAIQQTLEEATEEAAEVEDEAVTEAKGGEGEVVNGAGDGTTTTTTTTAAKKTTLKSSTGNVIKRATESEKADRAMHHLFAKKATEWLTVREFENTQSCVEALREEGREIWVTDLGQEAVCMTEEVLREYSNRNHGSGGDGNNGEEQSSSASSSILPSKLAIVFGTEAVGATAEMLQAADLRVYLPLRGFADSLNLSVATALVVHQLFVLDPTLVGSMSEEERKGLRKKWYAKLASQRLLPARQKKTMVKLQSFIHNCRTLAHKIETNQPIEAIERDKWEKCLLKQAELNDLQTKLDNDAARAVEGLVENPPEPITDMRRCDEHRVCFVGKGTKKQCTEVWKGMPATDKIASEQNTTAAYFRGLVVEE